MPFKWRSGQIVSQWVNSCRVDVPLAMPRRKAPVDAAPDDSVEDGTERNEADGLSIYNEQVHSLLNHLEAEGNPSAWTEPST